METAFEMKLYENKSDDEIATWLNVNWFKRELRNWKIKEVSGKRLWDVWRNEFYYWMYISNDAYYDLRELNPYFKPLISEQWFSLLQEKLTKKASISPKKIKEQNEAHYPFDRWLVTSTDGSAFTYTLPNPWRFKKKLIKLKETNKKATLGDIVKPNQISFRIMNKSSKDHNLTISFDEVEKQIIKFLNKINVDECEYQEFVNFAKGQADVINKQKRTESNRIQLRINKTTSKRTMYIKRHMGIERNQEEEKIYQQEMDKYDSELDILERDHRANNNSERNEVLELTVFLDIWLEGQVTTTKGQNMFKKEKLTIFCSRT